jgi:hypothetical protein
MKYLALLPVLLLSAGSLSLAASPSSIPEFKTLTGRTYRQCRITQVHPDGVSFFHSKGAAKVLFADLSDTWKSKLGYDARRAETYEKEQRMRKFVEQERLAKAREQHAAQQRQQAELQLKILERALLLEERRLLLGQSQLAAYYGAQIPVSGPAPAVGWPGSYFGPLSPIHGPSYGGRPWCNRGSIGLASIGGGSGGYLGIQNSGCVWVGGGRVWQSPTLGAYVPGRFAPFGTVAPFGGVYLGGARNIGQIGLGSVAWGFVPPAAAPVHAPAIRAGGSIAIPAAP